MLPASLPEPLVRTTGGRRTLEFAPGDIQSEMLLARPHALVLDYTRAMMGFALFAPRPRRILMVGLGGGSLAKFCHRHFPDARITVVEVRADVIALREQFMVPPDDARFSVVHADAAAWIAAWSGRERIDVLLLDGFDAAGLPPALADEAFYRACRRMLAPGGVLVANVFTYDPRHDAVLAQLAAAFDGNRSWFEGAAGDNRILYALAGPRPGGWRGRLLRRRGLRYGWLNRLLLRLLVGRIAATVMPKPQRQIDATEQ
jgi:spermidine synthase